MVYFIVANIDLFYLPQYQSPLYYLEVNFTCWTSEVFIGSLTRQVWHLHNVINRTDINGFVLTQTKIAVLFMNRLNKTVSGIFISHVISLFPTCPNDLLFRTYLSSLQLLVSWLGNLFSNQAFTELAEEFWMGKCMCGKEISFLELTFQVTFQSSEDRHHVPTTVSTRAATR